MNDFILSIIVSFSFESGEKPVYDGFIAEHFGSG